MFARSVTLLACAACHGSTTGSSVAALGTPHYAILSNPILAANNLTANVVRVVGTNSDGTPATDDVVLATSRPGSGYFASTHLELAELGAQTSFIACDRASTGCLGPLTLSVALASAPTIPIAHVDVTLVDPSLVDAAKQCRGGGNALYVKGNDQIFVGEETIDNSATWARAPLNDQATIDVTTATETWRLAFNTSRLQGLRLFPGPYEDATLADNDDPTQQPIALPAMNISMNGHVCAAITGRFTVLDNNQLDTVTIVFAQHCDGSTSTALHGCVHVQP